MNRFQFLGAQTDGAGQEWCYILDTQTGATLKSPVSIAGAAPVKTSSTTTSARPELFTAPRAVEDPAAVVEQRKSADPAGDIETPKQREERINNRNKVPPAFLGDIRRMHLDPAKTDGKTDITPTH